MNRFSGRGKKREAVMPATYDQGVAAANELLETFDATTSLEEAERALDSIAAGEYPEGLPLGDLYDGLAEAAAESGDFACAVRAQQRALELGCEWPELAREMLAWYLLLDGQIDSGEALFQRLRDERDDGDALLLLTLATARADAGLTEAALDAYDEAVAAAKAREPSLVEQARQERRHHRREMGLEEDADDRAATTRSLHQRQEEVVPAVAWFPRDEHGRALSKWPDLEHDLRDPDAYCARIERELRRTLELTGRNPAVAPLVVDKLEAFTAERDLSADSGAARSGYAAELLAAGEAVSWPPGRNDRCWCDSGQKYKRCCGVP
jgi:tetratricopeptide (TPR) repeat protein